MNAAIEDIELLARSSRRVKILAELGDERTLERDQLKERVDGSRTTLQRNLETLVEQGWIQNSHPEYRITQSGELVIEKFSELVDVVEVTRRLAPFLELVPLDEFDPEIHELADAELLLPTTGDPYAMINQHIAVLRTMDEARALLPFTGLHAHEAAHERIVHDGARAELVVEPTVAETYRSDDQYAPLFEEMMATERFDVSVYEGSLPFGVAIVDGTVQIAVVEDGEPRALLESEAEAVREWAHRKFEDYRTKARPLYDVSLAP